MEKRKIRVLIADDDQVLSLYKQYQADMLMLDINMPKLDGIAVLK